MTGSVQPHPERLRLFRSNWIEATSTITPRAFAAIWACVLTLVLYLAWGTADLPTSIALVVAGIAVWSLFEYAMHRFLFHWKIKWKTAAAVVFVMHGNHHVEPNDGDRNMMPPIVSIPWSASIWAAMALALGARGTLVYLGFAIGYVTYDMTHYACHQLPMRGWLLKRLRKHHIRHHYAQREGNYAITSIFWDRLFGTDITVKDH